MSLKAIYDCGARHSSSQIGRSANAVNGASIVANAGRGGNTPVMRIDGVSTTATYVSFTNFFEQLFLGGETSHEVYAAVRARMVNSSWGGTGGGFRFFAIMDVAGNEVFALGNDSGSSGFDRNVCAYKEGSNVGVVGILSNSLQLCVEMKVDKGAGTAEVRIEGQDAVSFSGLTWGSAGNPAKVVLGGGIGGVGCPLDFQDLQVCDGDGILPNTWFSPLGVVMTQFPTGAGDKSDWTPAGDTPNWKCVDESPADDFTTTVGSSVAGNEDLYTFPAVDSGVETVLAVVVAVEGQPATGGGSYSLQGSCKSSGTLANTATQTGKSSWADNFFVFPTDPHTSAAWGKTAAGNAQLGMKHVAA